MAFTRSNVDVNNIRSLPDQPNDSPSVLKYKFDKYGEDDKNYNNNTLLTELESIADGFSGADNIGATPLAGGVANTVQGILEELKSTQTTSDGQNVKLTGNQSISGTKTFLSSPVVPAPSSTTHATTKGYVDGLDAQNAKLTGDQSISGIKTFSLSPVIPTPTTSTQATTKGYVDGLDAQNVKLTGDQSVAGIKTFASSPIVPTPTTSTQASNKSYSDTAAASAVTTHKSESNAHAALNVSYDKTGTDLTSTNTNGAITELATKVKNIEQVNVNAEVVAARTSSVYGTTYTVLDDRFEYIENRIETPSTGTITLAPSTSIQSVTDSYAGMTDVEIGGATLQQSVVNGGVTSSLTANGTSRLIDINTDGTIEFNSAYDATNRTFDIISGQKYFLVALSSAGTFLNAVYLYYSDGSNQSFVGSGQSSNPYGIITANKTLKANFKLSEGAFSGTLTKTRMMLIPITGTPYESYTADQLKDMVNTYWEGIKSAQSGEVVSRGRNLFDKNKATQGFELSTVGLPTPNPSYFVSGFEPIKPSTVYAKSNTTRFYWYDKNKVFIERTIGTASATSNVNARFVRTEGLITALDTFMLNEGSTALQYVDYSESKLAYNCTDSSKFALSKLQNLSQSEINQSAGYISAVKRNQLYTILSAYVTAITNGTNNQYATIPLSNFTGLKTQVVSSIDGTVFFGGLYREVATLDVIGETYTFVTDATNLYIQVPLATWANIGTAQTALNNTQFIGQLATPVFIPYEQFADYGIDVDGSVSSNGKYSNFYITSNDVLPVVQIVYPTDISASVQGLKDAVVFVTDLATKTDDRIDVVENTYAPLDSPIFTGNPTAPTPTAGDNDTSIATTAFVATAVANGSSPVIASFSPTFYNQSGSLNPNVTINNAYSVKTNKEVRILARFTITSGDVSTIRNLPFTVNDSLVLQYRGVVHYIDGSGTIKGCGTLNAANYVLSDFNLTVAGTYTLDITYTTT